MSNFKSDYSTYADILHIHKQGSMTQGSVEMGDFTLDFGKDNEVVGVEIEHASEFFKNIDVNKESLSKIQQVRLVVDKRNPQSQLIFMQLTFPTSVEKIPLPMTVVS